MYARDLALGDEFFLQWAHGSFDGNILLIEDRPQRIVLAQDLVPLGVQHLRVLGEFIVHRVVSELEHAVDFREPLGIAILLLLVLQRLVLFALQLVLVVCYYFRLLDQLVLAGR